MSLKPEQEYDIDLINVFVHDLKTPLGAVKSYIELVQEYGELNDRQQHFSDRALDAVDRVTRIVHDLLDFVRVESDTPLRADECDMPLLVKEAVDLVVPAANSKQVTIAVEIDPTLGELIADASLLQHVMINLLSNAVKYNKEGGQVFVRIQDERAFIRIDVQDTGRGIAREDLKRVFDKFFRAKQKSGERIEGNGLGLALAKSIVLKHGGHIWAESVVGEGSTFSFTLPHHPVAYASDDAARTRQKREVGSWQPHDVAGQEDMDDMDDNLQEPQELSDTDSNSDELF